MRFIVILLISIFLLFYTLYPIPYTLVSATESNPPQTALTIGESSQMGQNNWYVTAVNLNLRATDDSGVKIISYYLNNPPITDQQMAGAIQETTNTTIVQNGENTFYYYSTDIYGNVENTRSQALKIDTVAPKNWREFTATEAGNNHTFIFTIKVSDQTSGLDPATAQFQYKVDDDEEWGYFEDLTKCQSGTWVENGWHQASLTPNTPGVKTATITTPAVDVCNSNWNETKKIKFKIKDIAGNESIAEFAISYPWLQTSGGDVGANDKITMTTVGPQPSTTGVASAVNSISNFSSTNNWLVTPYGAINRSLYDDFSQKLNPSSPLPNGKLPQTNSVGVYKVSGDFTLDEVTKPSPSANFTAVVFIDGALYINKAFTIGNASSLVFIVKDDINIEKNVAAVYGIYFTDDTFDTSYNGIDDKTALKIYGSLVANSFNFKRSLTRTVNLTTPSEEIIYQVSYLLNSNLITLLSGSARYTWQEVAP